MSSSRRWWPSLYTMLLGPPLPLALWWFVPPMLGVPYPRAAGGLALLAGIPISVLGVHLLPLRTLPRIGIALIYVPVMLAALLLGGFMLHCQLYPCH